MLSRFVNRSRPIFPDFQGIRALSLSFRREMVYTGLTIITSGKGAFLL